MHGKDSKREAVAAASPPPVVRAAYSRPTLLALGSFATVTRMMANGPYADGMLGLMAMQ